MEKHLLTQVLFSDCQKSFAEFSAEAENRVRTVFGRGVYVDENTSQAASVEFVSP